MIWRCILGFCLLGNAAPRGEALYQKYCTECHGDAGEGIEDEYELPLTGDDPVEMLREVIHRTMPEEHPKRVTAGAAEAVAAYIYDAFYSREAWQRVHPAKIVRARLTPHQFETSITDRVGSSWPGEARGLRRDDVGRWTGSVIADGTGDYEFVVHGDLDFRLQVNGRILLDSALPFDRKSRSRRAVIRLLAGRAYPMVLDWPVDMPRALHWKPPFGAEALLPHHHTSPEPVPASVVALPLPAGRERGLWRDRPITPAYREAVEANLPMIRSALGDAEFVIPEDFLFPPADDVARRLALILWDSIPDEELRSSPLSSKAAIRAQAKRMLRSPQTRIKLRMFFHNWLQIDGSVVLEKDAALFPEFDAGELRRSLDLFWDDLLWRGSADYRQLFLADSLFLNPALAKLYGMTPANESGFAKLRFAEDQRAGLITHPYLLAALAFPENSSPIDRGVFLTRRLLGRPLKSPHKSISVLGEVVALAEFAPDLTMREKIRELTKSEDCQVCHAVINPLGFSLEHYDALGRYRSQDHGRPIESGDRFPSDQADGVLLRNARDLAEFTAQDEGAQRSFVIRLFEYLNRQAIAAYGPGTVDELHTLFVASGFNMRQLVLEIAVRGCQNE
jgi:hypothetical protein